MGGVSRPLAVIGVGVVVGVALLFPLLYTPTPPVKGGGGGEIPEVEFWEGEFRLYTPYLSKKGSFRLLELYRDRHYFGRGVVAEDLLHSNYGKAEEVNGTGREVELRQFGVWNSQYRLESRKGVYSIPTGELVGEEFNLTSATGTGRGERFKLHRDRRVEGWGVDFKIKVRGW